MKTSPWRMMTARSRSAAWLAIGCGAAGGVANTAFLALVNAHLGARSGGDASSVGSSLALVGGFLAIAAALLVTYLASRLLLVGLLQRAVHDLRSDLARRLVAAPLPRVEALGPARLTTILNDDVATLASSLGMVPAISINAVMAAGSLLYLGVLSLELLGVLAVLLALAVWSFSALDALASRSLRQAREASDELGEDLQGLVHGNRELKLHRGKRRALLDGELRSHLDRVRDRNIAGNGRYALASTWGQLLTVLLIGVVLFVVPSVRAVSGDVLRGYALAVIQITGALGALLEALPALRRAQIAWRQIEELQAELAGGAEAVASASEEAAPASFRELVLDEVVYRVTRPGDADFQLGPISARFVPGELTFVTGGNGSGKTTLAKVLVGLYPLAAGRILVDGAPIDEGRRDGYRQLFAAAFTDGHVFRSLLGLDGAAVAAELASAELARWVHVEDGRLSTTALSQGQRKRLLLATALVEDRPFYVFDEWAANQDPEFRERFYRETLPSLAARGKAVVVITHDDRYEHLADRVLRLDGGQLRDAERKREPEMERVTAAPASDAGPPGEEETACAPQ